MYLLIQDDPRAQESENSYASTRYSFNLHDIDLASIKTVQLDSQAGGLSCDLSVPTCVLGDPMQAICGFGNDNLAKWEEQVCAYFPLVGELTTPWRWINADAEPLGRWLLEARGKLLCGEPIDLRAALASSPGTAAPDPVPWPAPRRATGARSTRQLSVRMPSPILSAHDRQRAWTSCRRRCERDRPNRPLPPRIHSALRSGSRVV
jgi:hypothetical protein